LTTRRDRFANGLKDYMHDKKADVSKAKWAKVMTEVWEPDCRNQASGISTRIYRQELHEDACVFSVYWANKHFWCEQPGMCQTVS
jgi:hypothetical protein